MDRLGRWHAQTPRRQTFYHLRRTAVGSTEWLLAASAVQGQRQLRRSRWTRTAGERQRRCELTCSGVADQCLGRRPSSVPDAWQGKCATRKTSLRPAFSRSRHRVRHWTSIRSRSPYLKPGLRSNERSQLLQPPSSPTGTPTNSSCAWSIATAPPSAARTTGSTSDCRSSWSLDSAQGQPASCRQSSCLRPASATRIDTGFLQIILSHSEFSGLAP